MVRQRVKTNSVREDILCVANFIRQDDEEFGLMKIKIWLVFSPILLLILTTCTGAEPPPAQVAVTLTPLVGRLSRLCP